MSNKRTTNTVNEELPIKKEQPSQSIGNQKFTIERLRKECYRIFGITTSTFDGATFGLEGEYTVEQMQAHLNNWKNKRATTAKKKEGN